MLKNGSSTLRILLTIVSVVAIVCATVLQAVGADATAAWLVVSSSVAGIVTLHVPAPGSPKPPGREDE